MMIKLSDLSRVVSHALRHEPWLYELELDDEGWVSIDLLLNSLRTYDNKWKNLNSIDLINMISASDKIRHEISNDRIRALYGHSIPGKLLKIPGKPPNILFHGTASKNLALIYREGLRPMNRQYVHLSTQIEIAEQVGKRKDPKPIILTIVAKEAYEHDVIFYQGNEQVWLVDALPPNFIQSP